MSNFEEYYGSKAKVFHGTAKMTKGGLQKSDIIRVKDSSGNFRYKSKKQHKKRKNPEITRRAKAMKKARNELISEGKIDKGDFVPVGGSTRKGKLLKKRMNEILGD